MASVHVVRLVCNVHAFSPMLATPPHPACLCRLLLGPASSGLHECGLQEGEPPRRSKRLASSQPASSLCIPVCMLDGTSFCVSMSCVDNFRGAVWSCFLIAAVPVPRWLSPQPQ